MIKRVLSPDFLVFGAAKSVVFFVPLLILWIEGASAYVMSEQAIAASLLVWPVFGFGMTAIYSYYVLQVKEPAFEYYFHRHLFFALALLFAGYAIVLIAVDDNFKYLLVLFIVTIMVFSYFSSIRYKCQNDVIRSSALDMLPYLGLVLYVLLESSGTGATPVFGAIIMTALVFYVWNRGEPLAGTDFVHTISEVYSNSFYSFLVGWIAVSVVMLPRVFIPEIATESESHELYLSLRIGTIMVLVYQFLQVSYYSRIFQIDKADLLKLVCVSWSIGAIFLLLILIVDAGVYIYFALFYTLCWISVSFMELQVIRTEKQKNVLLSAICFLAPFFLGFLYITTTGQLLILSGALLLVYFSIQVFSIYGVKFMISIIAMPAILSIGGICFG